MGGEPGLSMHAERRRTLLRFRRARTVLGLVVLFWLWAIFGSMSFLAVLMGRPLWVLLGAYALLVAMLISLPAAFGAGICMYLNRASASGTTTAGAAVVLLPAQPPPDQRTRTIPPVPLSRPRAS